MTRVSKQMVFMSDRAEAQVAGKCLLPPLKSKVVCVCVHPCLCNVFSAAASL